MSFENDATPLPVGPPVPVWAPRPAPPRSPMRGRYVVVEPLEDRRHVADLYDAYASDDAMWTYMAYGPFEESGAFQAWIDSVTALDDPMFHVIIDRAGPAGLAAYLRIEPSVGVIEIGHISLSRRLRRSRAATEAMYLMMRRAFDELGYRRYEWKADALNAASASAATRLGFTYEGTFRQATMYKGRNRDTAWYSIIDTEWPDRRAALEAWLDPANFDDQGRQRERLRR